MSTLNEPLELRDLFKRLSPSPLALVLILFLALSSFRVYGYFGSEVFHGPPIMIGFVLMWFVPTLFLTPYGRHQIGFGHSLSFKWIGLGILAGAALAGLCYLLGILLYGKTEHNWFVSIGYTFQSDERIAQLPRHIAFIAFTIPAIIASPIGEEIFFRGMVEQANRDRMSRFAASSFAATLFALVHLVHHGIYRGSHGIEIMPISAAIWFVLMFTTSLVFSFLRQKGKSIWTAVLAHSAFNLVMNITIFFSLFVSHPQTNPAG
ncbi:CAAX amino terminal protease family [Verrucomicrobiia bacterium DG1235]|nr:CAAX amino terminal protease family [Verrucomicrobiae bacterium DG1235]